ncbi:MAG TPA: hypothetical protein VF458_20385 [Ktedonobacteraceae bacterium]
MLWLASTAVNLTLGAAIPRNWVKIFPTGQQGHYALGSPDGCPLHPGDPLTVLVAGRRLTGIIQSGSQGDYIQLSDGSRCGLCPCMRVVNAVIQKQKVEVAG